MILMQMKMKEQKKFKMYLYYKYPKKFKKKKNPGDVPSSGKENDKSKDDGSQKKELKEVGTKDLINELIQRFPGSKNINIKERDEVPKEEVISTGSTFDGNTAQEINGGALDIHKGAWKSIGDRFEANVATAGSGGAISSVESNIRLDATTSCIKNQAVKQKEKWTKYER